MLDIAESEQEVSELIEVYEEAQSIQQQQHFTDNDIESDISAITSATTLSGGEEDNNKSHLSYHSEQTSTMTVTVYPVQSGQRSKFTELQSKCAEFLHKHTYTYRHICDLQNSLLF